MEGQAQNHSDHAGQNHAGELYASDRYRDAGQSCHKDDGGQDQVSGFAVIHLEMCIRDSIHTAQSRPVRYPAKSAAYPRSAAA